MKLNLKTIGPVAWEIIVWGSVAVLIASWFLGFLSEPARDILGSIIAVSIGIDIGRWLYGRKKPYLDRIDAAMASICYRRPDDESSVVVDHDDVRVAQEDGRLPPFFSVEAYFETHRINDYLRVNDITLPVRVSA